MGTCNPRRHRRAGPHLRLWRAAIMPVGILTMLSARWWNVAS
jgi:hypothetical protein